MFAFKRKEKPGLATRLSLGYCLLCERYRWRQRALRHGEVRIGLQCELIRRVERDCADRRVAFGRVLMGQVSP